MIKKNRICFDPLIAMGIFLVLISSCKKEEQKQVPVLTTTTISNITQTAATSGGNISSDGGAPIIAQGICWSLSTNPTIDNSRTNNSIGTGEFTSSMDGLSVGTNYFVRAYATNSIGTAYGNEISFSTNPVILPSISTKTVSSITSASAICGGDIISDGGSILTACGICWSTSGEPTVDNSKTNESIGVVTFFSNITSLLASTNYKVRAYATNSKGTAYGNLVNFTTNTATPPTIATIAVSSIAKFTATSGGNITSDGGSPITDRGVCWSTSNNPLVTGSHTSDGSGTGAFTSSIVGLAKGTTYYLRAYAINNVGMIYGNEVTFTTSTDILDGLNSVTGIGSNLGNFNPISVIGDQVWMWSPYGYMLITGYSPGMYYDNEDWLVSPAMNFTNCLNPTLTFDHVGRFFMDISGSNTNTKTKISVWVSTTSNGTSIVPSQWIQFSLPESAYFSGANWTFVSSGPLSLAAFKENSNVRIAFKYLSSSSDGYAGSWELKNVNVYDIK